MQVNIEELQNVFQNAFGEPVTINIETKKGDLEEWDSINHLNLIVELEDRYKISFSKDEIESFSSVKDIYEALSSK